VEVQQPAFVPVAIEGNTDTSLQRTQGRTFEEGIRVTWLGRIADFKYYPLMRCLEDLDALQPTIGLPVSVICVGGGDYEQALEGSLKNLSNLSVHNIQHIEPDVLPNFLLSNTDLLLGMGTSALEAARLGIPTLLLDASYGPLPASYRYKFLYEQEGFNLASVITKEAQTMGGITLGNVFQRLIRDFSDESKKTEDYFSVNHEMAECAKKLADACSATRLTFKELDSTGLLSRPLSYRLLLALRAFVK
jgi:hypothetical protein